VNGYQQRDSPAGGLRRGNPDNPREWLPDAVGRCGGAGPP